MKKSSDEKKFLFKVIAIVVAICVFDVVIIAALGGFEDIKFIGVLLAGMLFMAGLIVMFNAMNNTRRKDPLENNKNKDNDKSF